jgi:hypothetical protein
MSHVFAIFQVPGSMNHQQMVNLREDLDALAERHGVALETSQPITDITPPRALLTVFAAIAARYGIWRAARHAEIDITPPREAQELP